MEEIQIVLPPPCLNALTNEISSKNSLEPRCRLLTRNADEIEFYTQSGRASVKAVT